MSPSVVDEYVGGRNEKNERHGVGIWKHADGRQYAGGWRNGKRHGEGTMQYADESSYTGGFADGLRDGDGKFVSAKGGFVYEGGWKSGLMHGHGKMVGNIATLAPAGWQVKTSDAGVAHPPVSYEGQFTEGKLTGRGRITYGVGEAASSSADSSAANLLNQWQYEGDLVNGQRHGQGTLGDSRGNIIYSGGWNADDCHGFGELYHRDGRLSYRGQWRHGRRSSLNYYRLKGWAAWLLRSSHVARFVYWVTVDVFRTTLALTCLALIGLALAILLNPVPAKT